MAELALIGATIAAPGLAEFGTGHRDSIFPQDQALTNQWNIDRAYALREAAAYEDAGGVSDQNASGSGQSMFMLVGAGVSSMSLCFMLFMMMMTMI
jgi:hypothetical protein